MSSIVEENPVTISQVKRIAEARLPESVWRYYEDGADDQVTARSNGQAYNELLIRPRVLRDMTNVRTDTTIFGRKYAVPFAIAPTAYQKLAHPGGEIDMVRASISLGTSMVLSSNATTTLEDVAACLPAPASSGSQPRLWFQLYFLKDRNLTSRLIRRAEQAGYEALVLTVDTAVMGNRVHERHHPLTLPAGISMANSDSKESGGTSKGRLLLGAATNAEAQRVIHQHGPKMIDMGLTWSESIPWLRSQTGMKIIVKGILTSEDALQAVQAGVDAIIVSNHGGRQLDGVPASLRALPEVADAIGGRIPVIFDGGITRGSDIFKALALGANLCLLGRAPIWGLAHKGQTGVETVLHILERELWRTMVLAGASSISEISKGMLGLRNTTGFGIARL